MSSKTEYSSTEQKIQRYRRLARSLDGRIFASRSERLFVVSGKPSFKRLMSCNKFGSPAWESSPNPRELGFEYCDELTNYALQSRSHALTKWSRYLEQLIREDHRARTAEELQLELASIESTRRRLHQAFAWNRQVTDGNIPCNGPFLLSTSQERFLRETLCSGQGKAKFPHSVCWLARFVLWAAGEKALHRFLTAMIPTQRSPQEIFSIERLSKFKSQLRIWRQRSKSERTKHLQLEMRSALAALRPVIATRPGFSPRFHGRTFVDHCDFLIVESQKVLNELEATNLWRIPLGIAALVICDGGTAPIPHFLARHCSERTDCSEFYELIKTLHWQSKQAEYDSLLNVLCELSDSPNTAELPYLMSLVCSGSTASDIRWAQQNKILPAFCNSELPAGRAKHLLEQFDRLKVNLKLGERIELLAAFCRKKDLRLLDRLLEWMTHFESENLSPKQALLLKSGWLRVIVPAVTQLRGHVSLLQWADPFRQSQKEMDVSEENTQLKKFTDGITFYQQLKCGELSVPKSVCDQQEYANRIAKERAFLQDRVASGLATIKQNQRLVYIKNLEQQSTNMMRLVKSASEAFLVSALDALRTTVRRISQKEWEKVTGFPLPSMSLPQHFDYILCLNKMDDKQREQIRSVLSAWNRYGSSYKCHLPENEKWIAKAQNRLNLSEWLLPQTSFIGNDEVHSVHVENDPYEVFRIGTLFNTCLRPGSCNDMSLLAITHDANKHVVFARDRNGKVLGRQLLSVSKNFKMLGYYCYIRHGKQSDGARQKVFSAMQTFLGNWARACRLELANEGVAEKIGRQEWYDDGEWNWSVEALKAQRPLYFSTVIDISGPPFEEYFSAQAVW